MLGCSQLPCPLHFSLYATDFSKIKINCLSIGPNRKDTYYSWILIISTSGNQNKFCHFLNLHKATIHKDKTTISIGFKISNKLSDEISMYVTVPRAINSIYLI